VEGTRAVREAIDAGAAVSFAVVSPRLEATEVGVALRDELAAGGAEVCDVTDEAMEGLSDTDHPQGVLLVCREPAGRLDGLWGTSSGSDSGCVLVLDAIQDPGNVGTLVRSAVAFGLDAVIALDGTVDPWGTKAVRASAGMMFRLPVVRCTIGEALGVLESKGVSVLVASAEGTRLPPASALGPDRARRGVALVLGNEGVGVRRELREVADMAVAVPMPGPAESLNVGVAGSILMYELTRETR
jgi:TrmH family RNA methyltransferase